MRREIEYFHLAFRISYFEFLFCNSSSDGVFSIIKKSFLDENPLEFVNYYEFKRVLDNPFYGIDLTKRGWVVLPVNRSSGIKAGSTPANAARKDKGESIFFPLSA